MNEKKDHVIGIRFTNKERKLIEDFAEIRNSSLSEFIRESTFSHMNNLVDNINKIDLDAFSKNFNQITNATTIINNSINKLKKEIKIGGLNLEGNNDLKENMRNKPLKQSLWENNDRCPNCWKFIPESDRKKYRACENGYNYCSDRCAEVHLEEEYA